jgi:hypothetical protein
MAQYAYMDTNACCSKTRMGHRKDVITFVQHIVGSVKVETVAGEEAKFAVSCSTEPVLPLDNRARWQHCQCTGRQQVSCGRPIVHMN